MTIAQQTLVNRAKANGGSLALTPGPMLKAAQLIPATVGYVIANTLVLIGE
jgi:hypothetical protein